MVKQTWFLEWSLTYRGLPYFFYLQFPSGINYLILITYLSLSFWVPGNHHSFAGRGDPFQGLKLGSYVTLGNDLSEETHELTEQETLLGRGAWAGSSGVRGPRRTAVPLGFMVMGLASRLSLANHSDSESFLVVPCSALFSQDGCQWQGFGKVVRHMLSPLDFSQTLPAGGGLFVPCSLPGSPVVKELMQMITRVPG